MLEAFRAWGEGAGGIGENVLLGIGGGARRWASRGERAGSIREKALLGIGGRRERRERKRKGL